MRRNRQTQTNRKQESTFHEDRDVGYTATQNAPSLYPPSTPRMYLAYSRTCRSPGPSRASASSRCRSQGGCRIAGRRGRGLQDDAVIVGPGNHAPASVVDVGT